jgi:high-affinity nickel-transport protein
MLTGHPVIMDVQTPKANDNSGYIGAGIVGTFVLVVGGWYGGRWAINKWKKRTG